MLRNDVFVVFSFLLTIFSLQFQHECTLFEMFFRFVFFFYFIDHLVCILHHTKLKKKNMLLAAASFYLNIIVFSSKPLFHKSCACCLALLVCITTDFMIASLSISLVLFTFFVYTFFSFDLS